MHLSTGRSAKTRFSSKLATCNTSVNYLHTAAFALIIQTLLFLK